jgi:hypothetical protein
MQLASSGLSVDGMLTTLANVIEEQVSVASAIAKLTVCQGAFLLRLPVRIRLECMKEQVGWPEFLSLVVSVV